MTNDAKAQKAARNSKLVARYAGMDPGLAAIVSDKDGWDRIMEFAKRPAHIHQVEEFLEEIEQAGWSDRPEIQWEMRAVRRALRETIINQAIRARFGRRR